jgi:hypothetical protein
MFRRFIAAAAIGCALALAGCGQTGGMSNATGAQLGAGVGAVLGSTAASLASPATVSKVQTAAIKVCGFEPAASTVLGLLGKVSGYSAFTDPATEIADRICAAVTRTASAEPPAAYAALKRRKGKAAETPKGEVDGVPVKGRFVTPKSR